MNRNDHRLGADPDMSDRGVGKLEHRVFNAFGDGIVSGSEINGDGGLANREIVGLRISTDVIRWVGGGRGQRVIHSTGGRA